MTAYRRYALLASLAVAVATAAVTTAGAGQDPKSPYYAPQTPQDWAEIGKLPDWSASWTFDHDNELAQITKNPTPWNPKAKAVIDRQTKQRLSGPGAEGLFNNCLPEAMPTWMMISHNALEILLTPGRVTMLGEMDGNRIRRIYTDGRGHPADPDLSFHGHSIGHWEGTGPKATLVVDTVGIFPEAILAETETEGVPNQGDMHIVERIQEVEPDTIRVLMNITAPHILTREWQTPRFLHRQRAKRLDILEGVCRQGDFLQAVDKDGWHVFVPVKKDGGITVPGTVAGN